jgi:CubicO group peptidase (beta-lactamase class C family)
MTDSRRAAAMIAAAPPLWQPGTTHGYHALSIGVLMEELARRVAGSSLQAFYESEIRAPRGIDFYLGFPEAEEVRFREVNPPETPEPDLKPDEWRPTDGLQAIAFNVLGSDLPPTAGPLSPNNRSMRAAGIAAIGGIGSARGLADVYAAVLGDPTRAGLISSTTMELMSRQHTFGLDRVLGFTTSFGIVFMKPHPQLDFGSYSAFGHDGAGGALAFADPSYDLAFGYIPLPMQPPGGADPKAVRLTQRIRTIIRELP